MKNIILAIVALFTFATTIQAQKFTLSVKGFQVTEGVQTVKVRTVHYIHNDKVFALWQWTDMKTWTRVELEHGKDELLQVDSNQMPQYDYYVRKEVKAFFKVDTYIPKCFIFTKDLTIGSSGEEVSNLQTFLQENGRMEWWPDMEKGYFGNATAAALAAYQQYVGISPSSGYFGPLTRAHVNSKLE